MPMELTFLGATGTVTGSKSLLRTRAAAVLVDCGLFQGFKQLRLRNWQPLPIEPADVESVVLTHAHIDHSGYLPRFVKQGFRGRVFCSDATAALCRLLLPDAGHLQEEEARYANKHGFSKHKPALPLFTVEDARTALAHLEPLPFGHEARLAAGTSLRLLPAGHILGASIVRIESEGRTLVFSGDLGRCEDLMMRPPARIERADYLVVESTYGNRDHPRNDVEAEFAAAVSRAVNRGGVIVIPAFAVGRAQALLLVLARLKAAGRIPDVPIFLNSPMATDATELYHEHHDEHRVSPEECLAMFRVARFVRTAERSKALNTKYGPMIIISASGMATGGRVLHHLKAFAPDPRNMILFAGFQAAGTRGAALVDGAEAVKIHGEYVPVRAEVVFIDGLSAHADRSEILDWLGGFAAPPRRTFITHGEPAAADALRRAIGERMGWRCVVPDYRDTEALE